MEQYKRNADISLVDLDKNILSYICEYYLDFDTMIICAQLNSYFHKIISHICKQQCLTQTNSWIRNWQLLVRTNNYVKGRDISPVTISLKHNLSFIFNTPYRQCHNCHLNKVLTPCSRVNMDINKKWLAEQWVGCNKYWCVDCVNYLISNDKQYKYRCCIKYCPNGKQFISKHEKIVLCYQHYQKHGFNKIICTDNRCCGKYNSYLHNGKAHHHYCKLCYDAIVSKKYSIPRPLYICDLCKQDNIVNKCTQCGQLSCLKCSDIQLHICINNSMRTLCPQCNISCNICKVNMQCLVKDCPKMALTRDKLNIYSEQLHSLTKTESPKYYLCESHKPLHRIYLRLKQLVPLDK